MQVQMVGKRQSRPVLSALFGKRLGRKFQNVLSLVVSQELPCLAAAYIAQPRLSAINKAYL